MEKNIPRPEYPRPQFKRKEWQNLNGEWNFAFDDNNQGEKERWFKKESFDKKILVPFTFESKASGIEDRKEHSCIWYQRTFVVEAKKDKKVILNFGAADYITKVWLNGNFIGSHVGGYDAFCFDLSDYLNYQAENNLVIKIEDTMSKLQPRGKQSYKKDNFLCWYTRTTGIWQTVWLEYVAKEAYLKDVKLTPDIDSQEIELRYNFETSDLEEAGYKLLTEIKFEDKVIQSFKFDINKDSYNFKINVSDKNNEIKLWSPENPNLYEINYYLLKDEQKIDNVSSYFGMRKISIEDGKILLNNKPFYQKLILDQGYWPNTIATPPSDQAIKKDIELIKEMGFNGARKHQKIEDNRFYYWADKMGLVIWAEIGSTYEYADQVVDEFSSQWLRIVKELYNHPSIITWVPFNESWGIESIKTSRKEQQFTEGVYYLTKSIDPERPIICNDGWEHTISDIITIHDYEGRGNDKEIIEIYKDNKINLVDNKEVFNDGKYLMADNYTYQNQPIIFSEFGGLAFQNKEGWGYGKGVKDQTELIERINIMLEEIKMVDYFEGYCYTQLTDVEQEKNGLLDENRNFKAPLKEIKKINQIINK
ncbi:beta galactosidase jelly roll domain-containing protein [Halanaerobium sp. Z-7514]|uniref:Beta galactosidase jelly roll domain-containing protein n=1 Tax=Halanaerobium polyolivorans TaxID=2886943 RepID=A0AAW4X1R6_9FIRM|nr:sugar-binding domain-containing protein [Halanaerobium polyolivorans]MCC3145742.1 beta galactosidase jelly roll domain-containing protein [Halanaerobium polyolivorans]